MQDLFDQVEARGPGERQTDLEDLIAETTQVSLYDIMKNNHEKNFAAGHNYSCGEYQVHHVGHMEYQVVHATTGNTWTWFQGKGLTNLSDAAACAQWHNKYDQEEI